MWRHGKLLAPQEDLVVYRNHLHHKNHRRRDTLLLCSGTISFLCKQAIEQCRCSIGRSVFYFCSRPQRNVQPDSLGLNCLIPMIYECSCKLQYLWDNIRLAWLCLRSFVAKQWWMPLLEAAPPSVTPRAAFSTDEDLKKKKKKSAVAALVECSGRKSLCSCTC